MLASEAVAAIVFRVVAIRAYSHAKIAKGKERKGILFQFSLRTLLLANFA
jgi:hypothetical protein